MGKPRCSRLARTPGAPFTYANTLRLPPHLTQANTSIIRTQTTKTAGEGDDMLDGDVLPQHDDPLNEQADEPLAPGEVERLQAVPDGCSPKHVRRRGA